MLRRIISLSAGGYIIRELVKADDARWIDIVHRKSIQEARQADEDAPLYQFDLLKYSLSGKDTDDMDMIAIDAIGQENKYFGS